MAVGEGVDEVMGIGDEITGFRDCVINNGVIVASVWDENSDNNALGIDVGELVGDTVIIGEGVNDNDGDAP